MAGPTASDTRFRVSERQARELFEQFGTPLYVLDEASLRTRIQRFREAVRHASPNALVAYASKANPSFAVLAICAQEGCHIDVASEGELRAALSAGVPAHRCHLHGNNKSDNELRLAFEVGVGQIVVDNLREIERIAELRSVFGAARTADSEKPREALPVGNVCPDLLLRLAPGVDPITHKKISTGQDDTKFGFNIADGAAEGAVRLCMGLGLPLVGFHAHVGSQLLDPEAQRASAEALARFAVDMKLRQDFEARVLNVGGGLGARYTDDQHPMEIEAYVSLVTNAVLEVLDESGLIGNGFGPTLVHEPGRALVAESGVTLYSVGNVKRVPIGNGKIRKYVAVDGGLADNPRPALYAAKYSVERVAESQRAPDEDGAKSDRLSSEFSVEDDSPVLFDMYTICGRHCETDTLFEDVLMPLGLRSGDLLQVLCTGAYNSSMASNYNLYPRPATVLIRESGEYELIQRRDDFESMFQREILPHDLVSEGTQL